VELRLRLAGGTDVSALREVDALARNGDTQRIEFLHDAVRSGRCLIAESDTIIGFVVGTPGRFFGHDFIDLVVVHEAFRRRGVGRVLLRAAAERANTTRVFSSTNASNESMRSMFMAEGWTLSGQLHGLDEGDPEFVYFIDPASA